MPVTTDLDKFRLEIGDTDSTAPLFNDDEAEYFLDRRAGNVLQAAADACEALARKFARQFDFSEDGQSFKRSQMAAAYRQMAKDLRSRASGGVSTASFTRVDGYSEDIDARQGAGQARPSGRVRQGYFDPDIPA